MRDAHSVITMCHKALEEELNAWDDEIHHVREAFDACDAWLKQNPAPATRRSTKRTRPTPPTPEREVRG